MVGYVSWYQASREWGGAVVEGNVLDAVGMEGWMAGGQAKDCAGDPGGSAGQGKEGGVEG